MPTSAYNKDCIVSEKGRYSAPEACLFPSHDSGSCRPSGAHSGHWGGGRALLCEWLADFPYLTSSTRPTSPSSSLSLSVLVSSPCFVTVCCPLLPRLIVSFEVGLFCSLDCPLLWNTLTQRRYRRPSAGTGIRLAPVLSLVTYSTPRGSAGPLPFFVGVL